MGLINWRTLKDGPNVTGRARAFMAITPVAPDQAAELGAYLEDLAQDHSPLARLPGVHFGRFVIVTHLVPEDEHDPDLLPCPVLIFTACYDGAEEPFLDALVDKLAADAPQIWGRCIGCTDPTGEGLKGYLLHNQINSGFFASGYKDATVSDVRRALGNREKVIALAIRGQAMSPADLRAAFESELGSA